MKNPAKTLRCAPQVNTKGSGYAVLNYTGEGYAYEIYLYNVYGIKNIELHVAAPGTHGDVVAVFYAAAFQNPSQVSISHTVPLTNRLEFSISSSILGK